MPPRPPHPPATVLASCLLGLGAFALYVLLFPPQSDGILLRGSDVIILAGDLADGRTRGLWHPNHLLFHPLRAAVAYLWAGGPPDREAALWGQKIVAAAAAALCNVVLFRSAAHHCGAIAAGLLAALFGLLHATVFYAAIGENYLAATAATLALFAAAMQRPDSRWLVAWLTLAVLFRQDSVFAVCGLALLLPARRWLAVCAASGALALAVYVAAWWIADPGSGFLRWLAGLGADGRFSDQSLLQSLQRAGRAWLEVGCYAGTGWNLLGATPWLALALSLRRARAGAAMAARALVVTALLRELFFLWFAPGEIEYRGATAALLFLACGPLLARGWRPRLALAAAALTIAAWNAVHLAPLRGDEVAQRTHEAIERAGEGGFLVALDPHQGLAMARAGVAFMAIDPRTVTPGSPGMQALARSIALARRGNVRIVFARDAVLETALSRTSGRAVLELLANRPNVALVEDREGRPWMAYAPAGR